MVNFGVPQGYGIALGPTLEADTPGSTIPSTGVLNRSRNASMGGFIVPPLPLTGQAFMRLPRPSLGYGNPPSEIIVPPPTGAPFPLRAPFPIDGPIATRPPTGPMLPAPGSGPVINKSGPRMPSLAGDIVNATPLGSIGTTNDALRNARTRPLVPPDVRDAFSTRMPEAVRTRVTVLSRRLARVRSGRPTTARIGRE